MKKASILTMALALAALLLTGCDNGNVSRRNDGIVDGTNGTNVATLPTINDATGRVGTPATNPPDRTTPPTTPAPQKTTRRPAIPTVPAAPRTTKAASPLRAPAPPSAVRCRVPDGNCSQTARENLYLSAGFLLEHSAKALLLVPAIHTRIQVIFQALSLVWNPYRSRKPPGSASCLRMYRVRCPHLRRQLTAWPRSCSSIPLPRHAS